jgi:hypothetical protein
LRAEGDVVAEPEALDGAGPVALGEDVGPVDEAQHHLAAVVGLEVDGDGPLAGVDVGEPAAHPVLLEP